jgi:hypothetical protein
MNVEITSYPGNRMRGTKRSGSRSPGMTGRLQRYRRIIAIAAILIAIIAIPASAISGSTISSQPMGTGPRIVNVTIYVVDFNQFDVAAGTVGVDYYVNLKSDSPVSIDDVELMNGMITTVTPVLDTPNEKEYRVIAIVRAEPDLSRYPFDRDTLSIRMEPRLGSTREMVLVIDPRTSGISQEAHLPGWKFTGTGLSVTNTSYYPDETLYSRVVFNYNVTRDVTSTILKFFLPLMLIIIVSLSSLMMKTSSRLGLNASMFLATVLIHWRIADTIPIVTYATFLDLFMIITYATLVMVLLSGILLLKFAESGDTARVDRINSWSVRYIPPISITLYFLLFLTLVI